MISLIILHPFLLYRPATTTEKHSSSIVQHLHKQIIQPPIENHFATTILNMNSPTEDTILGDINPNILVEQLALIISPNKFDALLDNQPKVNSTFNAYT